MSTQEFAAGVHVWIRQCYARRNHPRDGEIARHSLRLWIRDLRALRAADKAKGQS